MSLKLKKGVNKQSAYNLRDPNVDYEAAQKFPLNQAQSRRRCWKQSRGDRR